MIVFAAFAVAGFLINGVTLHVGLPACFAVRMATWFLLYAGLARAKIITQFGYIQYLCFHVGLTFALWPTVVVIYEVFLPGHYATTSTLAEQLSDLHSGLVANDLVFTFLAIATGTYGILRISFGAPPKVTGFDLSAFNRLREQKTGRTAAILLILVSLIASRSSLLLPKVFQQPLILISYARFYGIFILLLSYLSAPPKSYTAKTRGLWFIGGLLVVAGWNFLLGGGQKGALIVQLYIIVLFILTTDWRLGLKTAGFCVLLCVPLVVLLPRLNAFKVVEAEGHDSSMTARARTLRSVMRGQGGFDATLGDSSSAVDYFLIYIPIRVTLTSMTSTYVAAYANEHVGWKQTAKLVISAFVPRILAPGKLDLDGYYNDLARTTGIGGYYDEETSRKPNLIEEAIVIDGVRGVVVIALVFGSFLYFAERAVYKFCGRKEIALAVLFATIAIAQLPYLGGLPAAIYILCANIYFGRKFLPGIMFK